MTTGGDLNRYSESMIPVDTQVAKRALQRFDSQKANHPDRVIMLPGPALDTFEARAEQ